MDVLVERFKRRKIVSDKNSPQLYYLCLLYTSPSCV